MCWLFAEVCNRETFENVIIGKRPGESFYVAGVVNPAAGGRIIVSAKSPSDGADLDMRKCTKGTNPGDCFNPRDLPGEEIFNTVRGVDAFGVRPQESNFVGRGIEGR